MAIAGVLVVFGVVSMPKKDNEDKEEENLDIQEKDNQTSEQEENMQDK